ncbi:unnamed protein product [Plutella xylostella]|uniref:(diamondback moth) hypothetical protein n=1 Tax=Plutella xylostella TaxID=51655 RepID=A0A8S4F0A6_PLUXY|nr:unnamed protein product [Plutella xylostella]
MARVLLFAVVLLSVHQVFGRDCSNVNSIVNCNECIRCGGYWCNKPEPGTPHCSLQADSWCPRDLETLDSVPDLTVPGTILSAVSFETNARVGATNRKLVHYSSSLEQKANIVIKNTTQNQDITLQTSTQCDENNCTVSIDVTPGKDFCTSNAGSAEYINARITFESIEEAVELKYHVPCACECSKKLPELSATICNSHGDYSCGACSCYKDWKGEFCEESDCGHDRGDVSCMSPINNLDCSGNGYCGGPCQTCQCYTDRPGSQYFERENNCVDLCQHINSYCDSCLQFPSEERCQDCQDLLFTPFNATALKSKDSQFRDVWVRCNETVGGCYKEYSAMRDASGDIVVMITASCDGIVAGAIVGTFRITIPVILGIIGFVAATAAAAGYLAYRARAPPLPLMDPQYTNIGAEDCTGVNPLYKPPTSSFINPTYRK